MKNKVPLICLHGALGCANDMLDLINYLNEAHETVLTFNFEGHGQGSTGPNEFRLDFFARDLDRFVKKHAFTQVNIFGHAFGGYVALYHKANFEDSPIQKIATYGTRFNWSPKNISKEMNLFDPEHLQLKYPQQVEILKSKHGENWKHLLRSTAHMYQNLEKLDGLTKDDLKEIQIPVMLILGDQDRVISTEEANLATSMIPKAQLKTLPFSKHELERSNLKELSNLINYSFE
jgi:pimeloyl-ACP methyl ester carboxylesterase